MTKRQILSVLAAGIFLCGLVLMLLVVPAQDSGKLPNGTDPTPTTTGAVSVFATDPPVETTTELPTEPPTEPPTELPTYPPAETMAPETLGLSAKYGFAYDCATDRYLYIGGDPDAQVAPASLTKLLTAYVVLQNMQPQQVVTVGSEITWIDPMSSVAFLQQGHRLTVEMLIQGLIMQSGNDAAYTLAVACGRVLAEDPQLDRREACQLFVAEMNAQAKLLGMKDSQFKNPDGIDETGHYTTVFDLVTLSLVGMENEMIMKYAGMATADVMFESGEICTWQNSNYLLREDKPFFTADAVGLKTGSTSGAGKCLLSLFRREDGSYLLLGVLGSETDDIRYTDTLILYNRYR